MLAQLEARIRELLQQVEKSVIEHHSLQGALQEARTLYEMYQAAEKAKAENPENPSA